VSVISKSKSLPLVAVTCIFGNRGLR
jgi:hypothetical protein